MSLARAARHRLILLGPTNLGPTNLGPTNLGPTNLGPTNLGPTNLGPTNLGPTNLGLHPAQSRARRFARPVRVQTEVDERDANWRGENCSSP